MAVLLQAALVLSLAAFSLQTGPIGPTGPSCECKSEQTLEVMQNLAATQATITSQLNLLKNELLAKVTAQDALIHRYGEAIQKQLATVNVDLSNKIDTKTTLQQKTIDTLNKYLKSITAATCPTGYSAFQDSCYKLVKAHIQWADALQKCREDGGHLLAIETVEEQRYVEGLVRQTIQASGQFNKDSRFWIGAHDRPSENNFVWESTGEKVTYTNWARGQPDNAGDEDCVQLWGGFTWNDDTCSDRFNFICEKKL